MFVTNVLRKVVQASEVVSLEEDSDPGVQLNSFRAVPLFIWIFKDFWQIFLSERKACLLHGALHVL